MRSRIERTRTANLAATASRRSKGLQHLAIALTVIAATAYAPPPAIAQQPAAVQPSSPAVALAPHRAVYEISLDQARGGTAVTDMSGRMVYELTGSTCDGYTQNMRFVTRMSTQEGVVLSDMRSSSWEDGVAKLFRFTSSQYKDAKLSESTQGDAARADGGGEVVVDLTKPGKKAVKLKQGIYFPIQHSIALLAAARKGETVFQADLYENRVQVSFDNVLAHLPHIASGKVRCLAVTTKTRSPLLPEAPTMAEAGVPGFESATNYTLFAPRALAPEIVARLNAAGNEAVADTDFRERMLKLGIVPVGSTVAEARGRMEAEVKRWAEVIRKGGIKPS